MQLAFGKLSPGSVLYFPTLDSRGNAKNLQHRAYHGFREEPVSAFLAGDIARRCKLLLQEYDSQMPLIRMRRPSKLISMRFTAARCILGTRIGCREDSLSHKPPLETRTGFMQRSWPRGVSGCTRLQPQCIPFVIDTWIFLFGRRCDRDVRGRELCINRSACRDLPSPLVIDGPPLTPTSQEAGKLSVLDISGGGRVPHRTHTNVMHLWLVGFHGLARCSQHTCGPLNLCRWWVVRTW